MFSFAAVLLSAKLVLLGMHQIINTSISQPVKDSGLRVPTGSPLQSSLVRVWTCRSKSRRSFQHAACGRDLEAKLPSVQSATTASCVWG